MTWRRGVAAAAVASVAVYLQLLSAFAFGTYYLADPGADRVREQLPNLAISLAVGLAGAAWILAIVRRPVLTPRLLASLVVPLLALLNHAGMTS